MAEQQDHLGTYRRLIQQQVSACHKELAEALAAKGHLGKKASEEERDRAENDVRSCQARLDEALARLVSVEVMENERLVRESERQSLQHATDSLRASADNLKAVTDRLNDLLKKRPADLKDRDAWLAEIRTLNETFHGHWTPYYNYGWFLWGWAWKEWAMYPKAPMPVSPGPATGAGPCPSIDVGVTLAPDKPVYYLHDSIGVIGAIRGGQPPYSPVTFELHSPDLTQDYNITSDPSQRWPTSRVTETWAVYLRGPGTPGTWGELNHCYIRVSVTDANGCKGSGKSREFTLRNMPHP